MTTNFSDDEAQETWNNAIFLLENSEFDRAIPLLEKLWSENYSGISFEIGAIYEKKSRSESAYILEAEKWYSRAVEENACFTSMYNYARFIISAYGDERGVGFNQNKVAMAVSILEKLSKDNCHYASLHLGAIFLSGRIAKKNIDKSEYFLLLSMKGCRYVLADIMLSEIYFEKNKYFKFIMHKFHAIKNMAILTIKNKNDERMALIDSISTRK